MPMYHKAAESLKKLNCILEFAPIVSTLEEEENLIFEAPKLQPDSF